MSGRQFVTSALRRFVLLLAVWWALAEGDFYGWPFALVFVTAATGASLVLLPPPPWRLRLLPALVFLGFFLREMLLAGIDVARRALDPSLPISPDFLTYPLSVESAAQRLLLAWTAGLLPGTVSVELGESTLELHLLDSRLPVSGTLRRLEKRIAGMFHDR